MDEPAILDVGIGMNRELVGRETVLNCLAAHHPGVTLRAVVQSWNERSLRLTRRLGFQCTGELVVVQGDRPVSYRIVRRRTEFAKPGALGRISSGVVDCGSMRTPL